MVGRRELEGRSRVTSKVGWPLRLIVFVSAALGGTGAASAKLVPHDICAFNMNGPQVFVATQPLTTIWSTNQGASWVHQYIYPDANPADDVGMVPDSIACASDGSNQAVVLARSWTGDIWAVDRLSGWQGRIVVGNFGSSEFISERAMTGTVVYDQGRTKFVFFVRSGNRQTWMVVWDDSANPKASIYAIDNVPGGFSSYAPDAFAAYSINVGLGASSAEVSLWAINDAGRLYVNSGTLGQPRQWFAASTPNYHPTSGPIFSNAVDFGPAAVAEYGSPFGHPGTYSDSDYNRWVEVPTADGKAVFTFSALRGATNFSWSEYGGASGYQRIQGGTARGCTRPGEPCAGSSTFVGINGSELGRFYGGPTDGSTSPAAGWSYLDISIEIPLPWTPLAYAWPTWTTYGSVFFYDLQSLADNVEKLDFLNLDTNVVTSLGPL